jgi:cytochrome c oxidase accessory protein FixG
LKSKNIFDLDPDRLATTDERGHRIFLYPEDVKGIWKSRRQVIYWFLIIVYLILPWFMINGRPALLIDIVNREFTFLGFTLYGVEPILFFLMVASGLFFIGFVTSLWGRVWCGWACPQTVFIQTLFMKLEALFEGKARERRELDKAPWNLSKFLRRSGKWTAFLVVSLHIAHTFVGYFVGPRELFRITLQAPSENWSVFVATMILTAIFFMDFGWFREQFCIIACPYGRMQSVLMDENSLVVGYDLKRGEPRREPGANMKNKEGDCINCYNCVKVCPTGIDIRRGTQLECIACTQCIDACDDIMRKLNKPSGLIRYSSEKEISGSQRKTFTFRSGVYATIGVIFIGLFFYFLNVSTHLHMVFLRSKVPFEVNGDQILNHFTLKLTHQGEKTFKVNFEADDKNIHIVTNSYPTVVEDAEKKIVLFFRFSKPQLMRGTRNVLVNAIDQDTNQIVSQKEVTLVGPAQ